MDSPLAAREEGLPTVIDGETPDAGVIEAALRPAGAERDCCGGCRAASIIDPLLHLRHAHREQRDLCERLEAIADSLPYPDAAECRQLAHDVEEALDRHHRLEDEILFPLLRRRLGAQSPLQGSIDRLMVEHIEDRDHAAEAAENLMRLADGCKRCEVDAIAFQLRGFFEAMQRHLAFEDEVILPKAEALLTNEEMAQLLADFRQASKRCADADMPARTLRPVG
ncbi:hemerythrin domain-containing protein [Mangrovicella endophytica]|uniref:hemerythrin domain-containing protein n=1 Tax=Mangrovicella endophytica TaxID=2066697 RepID=UPI000C9EB67A|nr:hemerythrin domain-containing protein [Mangrovicella endophytica]